MAPLTGLPTNAATAKRCSVMVKIGNTAEASPQWGLDSADVVYEEVVDGGITRLAAVFQSHAPTKVGGLRSTRPTDHNLVQPLHGVFAFSGGNGIELNAMNGVSAQLIDETAAGPMFTRDPNRTVPNNLFADVSQLYSRCPGGPPPQLFSYRRIGTRPAGTPASSGTIGFQSGYAVTWTWNPKDRSYRRTKFGAPDIEGPGKQVTATNVVVMSVPYPGGPLLPDNAANLIGKGPLKVFTAGHVITGTWTRPDPNKPAALHDRAGHVIQLTPGRTWVELPDPSYPLSNTP